MMARSSSSSPLQLSTGAQLPALTDSHSCHCTWCCTVMVLYVGLVQPTLVTSVSLFILCCVESQTGRLLCTVFVASGEEKQNLFFDAFLCLSFEQQLQDSRLTLHRFLFIFYFFNLVGQFIFFLYSSKGEHFPVWPLEGSSDCRVKPFPLGQTSLSMNGQLRRTSLSARWPRTDPLRKQQCRSLSGCGTNVKKSGDGFGKARSGFRCSNTHSVLSCYTWFPCKGPVPFSAMVLSSTSRARRVLLQAP